MIGHKLLVLITLLPFLNGCSLFSWDKLGIDYRVIYNNTTTDTLIITTAGYFISTIQLQESILYPECSTKMEPFVVYDGETPLSAFKNERVGLDSCWFYVMGDGLRQIASLNNDTVIDILNPNRKLLKILWSSPFIEDDEGIHSFFNLSSWVVDEKEHTITFSISVSDYIVNN